MNEVLLTPKFTILSSSPSQAAVAQSPAQTQTPSRHFLPKPPTYKRFFLQPFLLIFRTKQKRPDQIRINFSRSFRFKKPKSSVVSHLLSSSTNLPKSFLETSRNLATPAAGRACFTIWTKRKPNIIMHNYHYAILSIH